MLVLTNILNLQVGKFLSNQPTFKADQMVDASLICHAYLSEHNGVSLDLFCPLHVCSGPNVIKPFTDVIYEFL
jgi:hypothetical protein